VYIRAAVHAGVAKLADAPDLGSGAARHGGSSPSARTTRKIPEYSGIFFTPMRRYPIAAEVLSCPR
jgi:hypothetical protein